MSARSLILGSTVVVAALALTGCAGTASESVSSPAATAPSVESPHWSYAVAGSAEDWSGLDSSFATCGSGHRQSPIDLPTLVPDGDEAAELSLRTTTGETVDTGHTVQVVPDEPATTVEFDDEEWELAQWHSHSPSEHTIDGVRAPAEFHFVHANDDGELLVLGVLARAGAFSPAWQPYLQAEPGAPLDIDVSTLLPASLRTYQYEGSLTTPPCTEDVQWLVAADPIELSDEQIALIGSEHAGNSRVTQPLGDRVITGGSVLVDRD